MKDVYESVILLFLKKVIFQKSLGKYVSINWNWVFYFSKSKFLDIENILTTKTNLDFEMLELEFIFDFVNPQSHKLGISA